MKNNFLLNNFGLKINILLLVCLACLACRYGKIETNTGEMVSYRDSVFLEIKGDLNEDEVALGGREILGKAFVRMRRHLWLKDNRFVWNIENGAQVKVSENIYKCFADMWKHYNAKLSTGKYEVKEKNGGFCIEMIVTESDE